MPLSVSASRRIRMSAFAAVREKSSMLASVGWRKRARRSDSDAGLSMLLFRFVRFASNTALQPMGLTVSVW